MKTLSIVAITAFAFLGLANFASAQNQVTSTTFNDNGYLPLRAIDYRSFQISPAPGDVGNECAPNAPQTSEKQNQNQSPQLIFRFVSPPASFAVTAFDITAQVYHWGMYNISATMLPENAGAAGSPYGQQVRNYSENLGYIGPCPPADDPRGDPHKYEFRVYALRRSLTEVELPRNSDAAALVRALATPGLILGRASITGLWSSTPNLSPKQ